MRPVFSQRTAVIPDIQFRNYLISEYPTAFNAQNELLLDSAEKISGAINASYLNIKDISGIQYFTKISTIDIIGNEVTYIPDLSLLSGLEYLKLQNNKITFIPPLTQNHKLIALKCDTNNIRVLPDVKGLSNLNHIFCRNNQLNRLPDLTGCTNLDKIICTYNNIDSLPDFSANPLFSRLICHNNILKDLPDYSLHPNFNSMLCMNNQLSFEDFLLMQKHPKFSDTFDISPQDTLQLTQTTYHTSSGNSLTLSLGIDDTVTTNTYYWYKNDELISISNKNALIIDKANITHEGSYHVKITNSSSLLIGIELISETINVIIDPCTFEELPRYTVIESDCKLGSTITIDTVNCGINNIHQLHLVNEFNLDSLSSTTNNFTAVKNGSYQLILTSYTGCNLSIPNFINLVKPSNCDLIFSPDGDGINDEYFIEENGVAKIYNTKGLLVRTLEVPANWDGKNETDDLLPIGVYAIIIDDKRIINITLVH